MLSEKSERFLRNPQDRHMVAPTALAAKMQVDGRRILNAWDSIERAIEKAETNASFYYDPCLDDMLAILESWLFTVKVNALKTNPNHQGPEFVVVNWSDPESLKNRISLDKLTGLNIRNQHHEIEHAISILRDKGYEFETSKLMELQFEIAILNKKRHDLTGQIEKVLAGIDQELILPKNAHQHFADKS